MLKHAADGAKASLAALKRAVLAQFESAAITVGRAPWALPLELERLFHDTCVDMAHAFYEVERKYDGMDAGASGYLRKSIFEANTEDQRLVTGLALIIAVLRESRKQAGREDVPLSGLFWLFAGDNSDTSGLGSELRIEDLKDFEERFAPFESRLLDFEVDFVIENTPDTEFLEDIVNALVDRLAGLAY